MVWFERMLQKGVSWNANAWNYILLLSFSDVPLSAKLATGTQIRHSENHSIDKLRHL